MKKFKQAIRYISAGLIALFTANAHAAVPTVVSDAIATGTTDTATIAGSVLALIIGIAVFIWMRRAAK